MPPPQIKMYKDKAMKEEIPFIGFPDEVIEMGVEGNVEVFIANQSKFPYVVTDVKHDNKEVDVKLGSKVLDPFMPVKLTLVWKPPINENEEEWKPLVGDVSFRGYHVINK